MVETSAVLVMTRPGTRTLTVFRQAGAVDPVGHALPGASDTAMNCSEWSPLSGLLTVNDRVPDSLAPTARLSTQSTVPSGLVTRLPAVVVASLLYVASSPSPSRFRVTAAPV